MILPSTVLLCAVEQDKIKQKQCDGICGNDRQVARMNAALEGPRRPLTQSNALTPVGTERLALDQGGGAMAHMAEMGVEIGDAPRLVFDGVDWV